MKSKKAILALALVAGCAGKTETFPQIPNDTLASESVAVETLKKQEFTQATKPEKKEWIEGAEVEEALKETPAEDSITTLSLCEPIDERWKYPTKEQKKEVKTIIRKTCQEMGVGKEDCKYFLNIVSLRESSYRWWVRHKLAGDVAAAMNSYLSRSQRYGWTVRWDAKSRKREDLSKLEFEKHGDVQNPYFLEPRRWLFGLGLGALNVSYHLLKFDKTAPPEILCDPVINVMIQVTIARNAVRKYKAQNFAEIQAIYAGRTYYDDRGRARPLSCSRGCPKNSDAEQRARARKGDASILKRCEAKGLDCKRKPQLGTKLDLRNMTLEERYEAAERIRGAALPPFDTPPEDEIHPGVSEG